jgi:mRNA interferase MazF
VISQGEIWWADLPLPTGSGPGYRRPVVIVQSDAFNRSRIATVVCVPLTRNLRLADAPGNVFLPAQTTGLDDDSVANVSQISTIDRGLLTEQVGTLPAQWVQRILIGIDVVRDADIRQVTIGSSSCGPTRRTTGSRGPASSGRLSADCRMESATNP